jgi:hypothetical protein
MDSSVWRISHASAIGQAHVNQNTECQDRFQCRTVETPEGEVLIAAIADGAGSTTSGGRGAEIACKTFVESVADFLYARDASVKSLNEEFGAGWLGFARRKIVVAALKDEKTVRDYATTFLGAVVDKTSAAFYQIGDGGIVFSVAAAAPSYRFAVAPAETLYVNMTDFITDETAAQRFRFNFVEEAIEDLILFSDGIFPIAVNFQTNEPHAPFLAPMIAPLRNGADGDGLNGKLRDFLASPKINEKTDDDKTIILASRAARKTSAVSAEPHSDK